METRKIDMKQHILFKVVTSQNKYIRCDFIIITYSIIVSFVFQR